MIADALLSRLNKVKGRPGAWTACCPAHDDRSPSLSIREEDDRVLVHCHAGCSVEAVLGAVGLDMTDLFPPKPTTWPQPPHKRVRLFASDALRVMHMEATVVMVAAHNMAQGQTLHAEDLARLTEAWKRIDECMEGVNG